MASRITARPSDPRVDAFCDQLWLRDGLAASSLASYRRDLDAFDAWLRARGCDLLAATRADCEAWLAAQFEARARATSVARRLSALRRFYRLQLEQGAIATDPTLRVAPPRRPRRLPKLVSETQVEALLAAPDPSTALGLRDRAMLETLYATGLRVSELCGLRPGQGRCRVRGKPS
jgi:integrase/recombinase XerD